MKPLLVIAACAAVVGCQGVSRHPESPPLKSEREYAVDAAARAQALYRSGQAASLAEARARAAGEANAAWAAAATAAERRAAQREFEQQLAAAAGAKR